MKTVSIDRKRKLRDEPHTGHNRWHPDIPPVIEVDEGEEVALKTRDALDGHLHAKSTEADFASMATGAIHPLTGPVLVKGARPGDLLVTPATGAYGYAMANNYNGVPRPPVVFCSDGRATLAVRRETYGDLVSRDV